MLGRFHQWSHGLEILSRKQAGAIAKVSSSVFYFSEITVLSYLMCYVFKTFISYFLPGIADISDEKVSLVPITPSWWKVEVPTLFWQQVPGSDHEE